MKHCCDCPTRGAGVKRRPGRAACGVSLTCIHPHPRVLANMPTLDCLAGWLDFCRGFKAVAGDFDCRRSDDVFAFQVCQTEFFKAFRKAAVLLPVITLGVVDVMQVVTYRLGRVEMELGGAHRG